MPASFGLPEVMKKALNAFLQRLSAVNVLNGQRDFIPRHNRLLVRFLEISGPPRRIKDLCG
jgi:hypothetical protein